MGGRFRLASILVAAGILTGGAATAGLPDPAFSDVGNVLFVPGASIPYEVTIGSANGPEPGVVVTLVFNAVGNPLVCWCEGQSHPTGLEAITDASGVATFFIAGGGCIDPAAVATPPVDVYVNGSLFAAVGTVSPDAVDNSGNLPTGGWVPGNSCEVGVGDAVFHTPALKTGTYSYCTDFDSDHDCDLTDAVLLTPAVKHGVSCTHGP